jgi:hypothetical protein
MDTGPAAEEENEMRGVVGRLSVILMSGAVLGGVLLRGFMRQVGGRKPPAQAFSVGGDRPAVRNAPAGPLLIDLATHAFELCEDEEAFGWLSDRELLRVRDLPDGQWEIAKVDSVSGHETPLRALSRLFSASKGVTDEACLSPDRRYFLWYSMSGRRHVASLDGSYHQTWPGRQLRHDEDRFGIAWMGDSRHWIELMPIGDPRSLHPVPVELVFVRTLGERRTRVLRLAGESSAFNREGDGLSLGAAISADRVLFISTQGQARVVEASLHGNAEPTRRFSIPLPGDAVAREAVFSPQADRIAWKLEREDRNHSLREVGIWTCRTDGSGLQEVGHWLIASSDASHPEPEHIRWLPSGRGLSFDYRDELYTIPTP